MNKKLMVVLALLFAAIFVATPFVTRAGAESPTVSLAQTSKAAILLDRDTGTVVFEKAPTDRLPIASMVKIMTLAIAFDEIEKRDIDLGSAVTVSQNASSMGGSQAFLDANATYRLDELLKSIVVASANDSCVAVAEYLYGSVDAFVAEMNARAKEWGMENTAFSNCTGLPKDGQYCCAADVAIMFGKLIRHDRFFDYAKVWMYDFRHPDGRITQLTNTNKLIRFYDGCDGGKTGYTDAARSCIAVTAKRGDTRFICVTIGAENSKSRNREVSEMLNYGFANYKTVYAVKKGADAGIFPVNGGKTDCINAVAGEDKTVFIRSGDKCDISLEPKVGDICAPVREGDEIGKLSVRINGEEYAKVPLIAAEECEKRGYLDVVDKFIEAW